MKKIILIISSLIILISISFGYIYLNNQVKQSQIKYSLTDNSREYIEYNVVKCGLFSGQYAFIDTFRDNQFEIYFHKINFKDSFYSESIDWDNNYVGGTDIKNTTFPQLLKMVKEDCSQFQKSSGLGIEETSMKWVYSKAESQESIDKRKQESKKEEIEEKRNDVSRLSKDKLKELKEKYGYKKDFTDDEFLFWSKNTDFSNFNSGIQKESSNLLPGLKIIE